MPLGQFLRLIFNGASEFFGNIASSVIGLILNFFLLCYGGTTAVAAMSVVMYVDSVVGMLLFGMCDALQPAISYCYGAGLVKKVKALEKRVLISAAGLSVISLLFLRYIGPMIAPLFVMDGDEELLRASRDAMRLFSLSYLVGWVDMCLSSYFTALEKPVRSFLVSLVGTVILPLAALIVMAPLLGMSGILLSFTAAGTISAVVTTVFAVTIKFDEKSS